MSLVFLLWSDFFVMGGYVFFVWLVVVMIVVLLVLLVLYMVL